MLNVEGTRDLQKDWLETLYCANSKSAVIIGPSASPTAYWTLAVFPVVFAFGTESAAIHKSELADADVSLKLNKLKVEANLPSSI